MGQIQQARAGKGPAGDFPITRFWLPFTIRYLGRLWRRRRRVNLRVNGGRPPSAFDFPFVVSGSTWITALSTSKGYRTMNGKPHCLFMTSCRTASKKGSADQRSKVGQFGFRLRSRCPQGDRSHRADVDAGPAVVARRHGFLVHPIEINQSVKPSLGKIHLRPAFLCSAHPNAPSTQNTPAGIVVNEGMISDKARFLQVLFKAFGFQAHAEESGQILKRALLVYRAVRAVHIVNREQKPKSAFLQISDRWSVGLDNQRRSDLDGAGRNGFPLDFDEAQPARCVRMLHPVKVAEVGDINAVEQAGFEQNGSLLDFNLFMIY